MAFARQAAKTPTSIGAIVVTLKDAPATAENPQIRTAYFQVEVLDVNGDRIRLLRGDLVPHLTQAQAAGLLDFMADLRTQAENEVLPA